LPTSAVAALDDAGTAGAGGNPAEQSEEQQRAYGN
jgi:hypothetical protein